MRAHIVVSGRVQGVGFRYAAVREARRLGLTGWVRNTEDGKVEAVAEGDSESVRVFLEWCHQGPLGARVTTVQHWEEPARDPWEGFQIRY
jgi:acylphosphatase